jgi:hypothetical protein
MGGCSKPGSGAVGGSAAAVVGADEEDSLVAVEQVDTVALVYPGLFGLVDIAKFADELELVFGFRIFPSAELASVSAGLAFGLVSEEASIKKNYRRRLL